MVSTQAKSDVVIVGGGVIGLSLAWELAGRGQVVQVLDAGSIGRGASWAGAGILPPAAKRGAVDPYEQLRSLSHELHATWASHLRRETGVDSGYRRCGGIYLARTAAEAATLTANELWWEEHGIDYEKWTRQELLEREPRLAGQVSADFRGVWFLPDECQLRNPRHLKALASACEKRGVQLLPETPVDQILIRGKQTSGVVARGQQFDARLVCICSGAWARKSLDQLGIANGVMPVRGQMVLYQAGECLLSHVVNEGHRYLVPRDDGRLLAGSIEEEVGYVNETTEEGISQIRSWAEQILPDVRNCRVEQTWAGLRPGSFDGLPYIGQIPGYENLFLATGHFRSGLHLSCGTAVVLAEAILGGESRIDLSPFRVGRG